jgi:hypothetical protein
MAATAIPVRHAESPVNPPPQAAPESRPADALAPLVAAPVAKPTPPAAPEQPVVRVRQQTPEGPTGTTFSWAQLGTYLLSERTLHALLGLGAFLILASGAVISIFNPTGLGPLLHLATVLCTTLLFYGAGYVVRQRLHLALTGAAFLGIGGAFIPLCVWTLGQELLHWQPAAIWLLASMVSLPIYLASHALLRDRTFAVLVAVAGGSELLALVNWLGMPLEWALVLLIGLGCVYAWIARCLDEQWRTLAWALAWTAQVTVPAVMAILLAAGVYPSAWAAAAPRAQGSVNEYAVGTAWWLGAGFFGLASALPHQRWCRALAIWTVPVAYLLTLTKMPWEPAWHAVALSALAGGYLLYGHWRQADVDCTYRSLAAEPLYQVALVLTVVAAAWPSATPNSRIATLLTLAVVYGSAAEFLRQRVWAYVAIYLLPITYGLLLDRLRVDAVLRALAWTGLAIVLLGVAELYVRWTAEDRRPLTDTIIGRGEWRSRFASPLFSAGYAVGALALWLAWTNYWNAPAEAGIRQLDTPTILTFLALVAFGSASSVLRRTSVFLFLTTWLFLIPFQATVGRVFVHLGWPMSEAELARMLALLGVGYLFLAHTTDRFGGHYAKPVYLVGYALSLATMPLSMLDRAINTQVVALSIAIYATSAWLVDRERHPSFTWLVARLTGRSDRPAARHMGCLFLYLAAWLFPVWVLLAMSLRWPLLASGEYGLALAILAPAYAAMGLRARQIRPEYRWPWYLAGYAMSAIGPMAALADPVLRLGALTISVVLYGVSAVISRQSAWLYLVALLTPVLVWQGLERMSVEPRFYGIALVALAFVYVAVGVVLYDRTIKMARLLRSVDAPIDAFARPFFVVAFGLSACGLALVSSQERALVVVGFALASILYGISAFVFRQSLFTYPMLGSAAVAYVVGMTMTDLRWQAYGLGLLPGMLACLGLGEVFRRRLDVRPVAARVRLVDRWATPFFSAAYLGTLAVPVWSMTDQTIWAAAWWSVVLVYALSVALFRRPGRLYPTLAAALVAFLATAFAVIPQLSAATAVAALVGPATLLFGVAVILARREPCKPTLAAMTKSRRIRVPAWPDPFVVVGWLALPVAVGASISNPTAGFWAAATAAVVVAAVGTLWYGDAEVWISLALAALGYGQAMVVLGVPIASQPPAWAVAGLGAGLVAIGVRRSAWRAVVMWPEPLHVASLVAGGGAILFGLSLLFSIGRQEGLQALSATVALTGLTLVAHGFDRHERVLSYQGVALLLIGYMLQLVWFNVGQPQAFALPAGIYLLAIAYLEWRHGTDHRIKGILETAGLVLLLGVSLIQAVGFLGAGFDRYAYATFLLLESVALFGLGALLHWRRSFLAGAVALVIDLVILLVDPLRAMNTWYLVAVIGLAMIGAVILIEQRRQRIPFWLHEWQLRLESWD